MRSFLERKLVLQRSLGVVDIVFESVRVNERVATIRFVNALEFVGQRKCLSMLGKKYVAGQRA